LGFFYLFLDCQKKKIAVSKEIMEYESSILFVSIRSLFLFFYFATIDNLLQWNKRFSPFLIFFHKKHWHLN